MPILYHEKSRQFHLTNDAISYVLHVLPNEQLGQLYFGKTIQDRPSFAHFFEGGLRSLAAYVYEDDYHFSLNHTRQEYPSYGTTDFRQPSFEIKQENGSTITNFQYQSHRIYNGKARLEGLPATYVEQDEEAETVEITLYDKLIDIELLLSYTIFANRAAITRHVKFSNCGKQQLVLTKALSVCVDLPDYDYEMIQLTGAWSRERHVKHRPLQHGLQSIYSLRGTSSAEFNPFIALKRPSTTEFSGEAIGFSFVYSGNFLAQVEVDTHDAARVLMGIHPDHFEWQLSVGESFQTPEVVIAYTDQGMNDLSQTYHELYRNRLARGQWRNAPRPILINNWESTSFDFNEEKIIHFASKAKELGIELFVLDDGWFGERNNDRAGLGDWVVNEHKLPNGIKGLAGKIEELGMKFGLWFEPEMVNKDSELYRNHPDWIIHTPGRNASPSRNQYVLDFSRSEVVQYIYEAMSKVLRESAISYVKWDMNRYITECYSISLSTSEQGKVFHSYILGVYSLYERLTAEFPHILFESCSSGGARFDPGMLYYAPQVWTSDNTDAIERLKIQYGTSFVYPLSSMGAHVSEVPNQQVGRITSIETRANVSYFGAFGYELDLNELSLEEQEKVKEQVSFAKQHRELLKIGKFYRLQSPFSNEAGAWMVVSQAGDEALVGFYQIMNIANRGWRRLRLAGLHTDTLYTINGNADRQHYGDELQQAGLVIHQNELSSGGGDFASVLYHLRA